jgi:hypothetical protein
MRSWRMVVDGWPPPWGWLLDRWAGNCCLLAIHSYGFVSLCLCLSLCTSSLARSYSGHFLMFLVNSSSPFDPYRPFDRPWAPMQVAWLETGACNWFQRNVSWYTLQATWSPERFLNRTKGCRNSVCRFSWHGITLSTYQSVAALVHLANSSCSPRVLLSWAHELCQNDAIVCVDKYGAPSQKIGWP